MPVGVHWRKQQPIPPQEGHNGAPMMTDLTSGGSQVPNPSRRMPQNQPGGGPQPTLPMPGQPGPFQAIPRAPDRFMVQAQQPDGYGQAPDLGSIMALIQRLFGHG